MYSNRNNKKYKPRYGNDAYVYKVWESVKLGAIALLIIKAIKLIMNLLP